MKEMRFQFLGGEDQGETASTPVFLPGQTQPGHFSLDRGLQVELQVHGGRKGVRHNLTKQ